MTDKRKYFDLVIGDDIKFYVGGNACCYPMTFTLEECVEEYCAMHDMELVRICELNPHINGASKEGEFWYKRVEREKSWTETFGQVNNVQQAVMRMGMSMGEVASAMNRVANRLSGWMSAADEWHIGGDDEDE